MVELRRKTLCEHYRKLNGGPFLGHTEHHSGLDVDIQFKEYTFEGKKIVFDFNNLGNDPVRWKKVLDELDTFLGGISTYYRFIRNIYVSREYNQNSALYLNNRFENRCYNGRYINFDSLWGSGTLLRDVVGHHNHLHLSFLPTENNGDYGEIDLGVSSMSQIKLEDFYFNLDSTGTNLTVEPIITSDFESKYKLFWRFQDSNDFSSTSLVTTFGEWPNVIKKNKNQINSHFDKTSSIRYIHLAIARDNGVSLSHTVPSSPSEKKKYVNGACVERSVAVDVGKLKTNRRWKFVKHSKDYVMEYL